MKNQKGFTLIEILIYTSAIAIIGVSIVGILSNVITVQTKQKSSEEVTTQLNFVMQTIRRLVTESSLIDDSTGGSVLNLRMGTSTMSTTTIYSAANAVTMKIYNETTGTSSVSTLTNTKVLLDQLSFTKVSSGPGHDVVQISIQLSYNTQNPSSRAVRNLQSSIARISAATFDSNLLPNADNSLSIGLGPSPRWRDATFSNNVIVGNRIGIGTINPLNALSVSGGISAGSYVDTTAPTNGMIISGNVGIGTAAPETLLHLKNSSGSTYAKTEVAANSEVGFDIKKTGATNQEWKIADGVTVNGVLQFYDVTDSRAALNIDGAGNVGIGTATPQGTLDLTSTGLLTFGSDYKWGMSAGIVKFNRGNAYPTGYTFDVAAASGIFIDSSGNVNIGNGSLSVGSAIMVDSGAHLQMNRLEVGNFDAGVNGYMILGAIGTDVSGQNCDTICGNHGLACSFAYYFYTGTGHTGLAACSYSYYPKLCFCL